MTRTFSLLAAVAFLHACAALAEPVPPLKLGTPLDRPYELDLRFHPESWQTSICLVDDGQKTIVGKDGALLYDYPGPFADFGTRVRVEFAEPGEEWVGQALDSPRTPILATDSRCGAFTLRQTAFAVAGKTAATLKPIAPETLEGLEGRGVESVGDHAPQENWAAPRGRADKTFAGVDIGFGHALQYRFAATPKKTYWVAFGLCEGYWDKPGHRALDLKIEGKVCKTVDPVELAGKNKAFVVPVEARDLNGDGWIDIEVAASAKATDSNSILNALWVFEKKPDTDAVIEGRATRGALAYAPCGEGPVITNAPPRVDLLLAELTNTGTESATPAVRVTVQSNGALSFDEGSGSVLVREVPALTVSERVTAGREGNMLTLALPAVAIKPNETKAFVIAMHRNAAAHVWSVEEAHAALSYAQHYWQTADLPYGKVSVPDTAVQGLFDSCIRNIYQAREIKKGLPAFQVGPTCYRGLWVVDGAFLLESISMLGRTDETRAGVAYLLSHQNEDGSFELLPKYWKETGIVLWVIDRHEQLTGDRAWLEQTWPCVEKAANFIIELRRRASADPAAPHAGLTPPGVCDGGLGGEMSEYTNPYWILTGLKSAAAMAARIGKTDEEERWRAEFDDMWAAYRKAAERDLITDSFGNRMLPIPMERPLKAAPQRAQWAFCHAVYPGELFAADDPIMRGTMANLTDNETEGLVYGTGWIEDGLWNYFGSFYAHAFMWLGEGQKAAQTAYAFANHAAPTLLWREEQMPQGKKPKIVGDMPHNWASAEFIRCVIHLLLIERGDELHLFEGLPPTWLKPGARIEVNGVETRFGPVTMSLVVDGEGKTARLTVQPPARRPATKVVVHLGEHLQTADGGTGTLELTADKAAKVTLSTR